MDEIIFPPGTPDEFKDQVNSLYQRQQMATEDFQHRVAALFDGFTEEQLVTHKHMMHHLVMLTNAHGDTLAAYYEGIATGLLHVKYGVCLGCDQNHEKLMEEAGFGGQQPVDIEESEVAADPEMCTTGGDWPVSELQQKQMDEYNLDDLRDEETNRLIGFTCKNCGMRYLSISDRMLREPGVEGCGGCQQKAKWG